MEASQRTVRVIARRAGVALVISAVAAAAGVGMGHAFADTGGSVSHTAVTWSKSDPANLAVPARKVRGHAGGPQQFQTISESFTAPNFETKFVLCPAGTPFVVGGGAQAESPNRAVLNRSYPISGPVPADGWAASGYAPYGSHVELVIYAICTGQ
jgi:hypothetical protein